MKRVTTLIAGLVLLFAASAQAAGSKDEDAIKARVAEFSALFGKGDAKALAAFSPTTRRWSTRRDEGEGPGGD